MIKELTLTILLVTGSPLSVPTRDARTIVNYSLKNCVNSKQKEFTIKYKKVKWVKRRASSIKRANTNTQRFDKWDFYIFHQVRRKKLKRNTNLIYVFDISDQDGGLRGGLSYLCQGWKSEAEAIVWGSHSRLDVTFIDRPLDVNASLFCHEIGHATGRGHCGDINNVMFPYYYYTGNIPLAEKPMCDSFGLKQCKRNPDNFSPFGCGFKHG
jgi:predicted Zn-dependent protease